LSNLWRIHKNRESKGLGGTYDATGLYDNKVAHNTFKALDENWPL
jgi:hypothetical protein